MTPTERRQLVAALDDLLAASAAVRSLLAPRRSEHRSLARLDDALGEYMAALRDARSYWHPDRVH